MMNKPTCVTVQKLSVTRGACLVLDDVSFSLARGRIIGLLGPSGSGKSTLLRSIVGNQIISSGTVKVLDYSAGHKSLRRRVGYMTQAPSVYDDLSVQQNIGYFSRILAVPPAEVDRVISLTDLDGQRNRLARSLSGGQLNRVSLAIALLGSPDIVILDEPTVGLDPVLRASLWEIFAKLAATGMCLIISSHVMDEAMRCDELLLIREGKLLAQLTPTQLLSQTGAENPESAFLALINADQKTQPATNPPSRARHRTSAAGEKP